MLTPFILFIELNPKSVDRKNPRGYLTIYVNDMKTGNDAIIFKSISFCETECSFVFYDFCIELFLLFYLLFLQDSAYLFGSGI